MAGTRGEIMRHFGFGLLAGAIALLAIPEALSAAPGAIGIQTEDVARFYQVYGRAKGHPTAAELQRDYLDPGTVGLHHLLKVRNVTAERIAQAIETRPEIYSNARSCLEALPRVRARLDAAFGKLLELYPQADKPPVTILISRGKPLAISGPGDGVQIALEAMCAKDIGALLGSDLDDRFVHVTAHEYIHAQQSPVLANDEHPTVLERSLVEGVAEFVGELISGDISNVAVRAAAKGHEHEIETRFAADLDKTDLTAWVDNTTPQDIGELGYFIGYRIAKSYYQHARDKRSAVAELIQATDAHAVLAKSGWYPGIVLD
jgi:hypothetical protein